MPIGPGIHVGQRQGDAGRVERDRPLAVQGGEQAGAGLAAVLHDETPVGEDDEIVAIRSIAAGEQHVGLKAAQAGPGHQRSVEDRLAIATVFAKRPVQGLPGACSDPGVVDPLRRNGDRKAVVKFPATVLLRRPAVE